MKALYNENEPFAAQWLRNLIEAGHIAPGDVAECSIEDIRPADLAGYGQFHAFAGIGIWSSALRAAGWSDSEPVWTGSCPCQPFSAAGQGGGFADERHLWPAFHHLIDVCKPPVVIGEQVASPDGLRWLDLVQDDMEASGYAFGAADLCAAGAGVGFAESAEGAATLEWLRGALLHCPDPALASALRDFAAWAGAGLGYGAAHIRQRLYWVADAGRQRSAGWRDIRDVGSAPNGEFERYSDARTVADAQSQQRGLSVRQEQKTHTQSEWSRQTSAVADADGGLSRDRNLQRSGQHRFGATDSGAGARGRVAHDWIVCTDGKARPTQPGVLPLAHDWRGPSRVALLRAAGNAIHKETAVAFLRACRGLDLH